MRLFELIQPSDSYSDAWKRAEAKGLPMDRESRMARAEAMGFDTGTVYYKGMYPYDWNKETENDPGPEITKIHRSTIFPAFSGDEPGIRIAGFFTPDPKVANYFSMVSGSAGYPVFLKFTNVSTMDARGRTAGSLQFGDSGGAFRDVVRSGKYDIVKINNTEDEGNLVVVIDPRNIRSIHAAFDPDNVDSPDLLEVSSTADGETFSRSVKTKYKYPRASGRSPDVSFEQFIEGNKKVLFTSTTELDGISLRDQVVAVSAGDELFTDKRGHQHLIFWKEGAEKQAKRIIHMYQNEDWYSPEFHAEVGRTLQYPEDEITTFVARNTPHWVAKKAAEEENRK